MARSKTKKDEMKEPVEDVDVNEDQHSDNVSSISMHPSKLAAMAQAVNLIGTMSGEDLNNFLDMVKQMTAGGEAIPDGASAHNQGTIVMKPSDASPKMHESIKEDLAIVFGEDKNLSEEFKDKLSTLFEAAVSARVGLEKASIEEELQAKAEEEVEAALETLTENFNQYITYVAEEWIKENQVAIESTLKNELVEDFIGALKDVFESHYIQVPEDKVDVLEAMASKVDDLEERLNTAMNENMELQGMIAEFAKEELVDEVSEGLALSQKEKFRTLVEGVELTDPETYATKLAIIREKYFPTEGSKSNILTEDGEVDTNTDKTKVEEPAMKNYLAALNRFASK